jgi:hypothetical protein
MRVIGRIAKATIFHGLCSKGMGDNGEKKHLHIGLFGLPRSGSMDANMKIKNNFYTANLAGTPIYGCRRHGE